MSNIDQQALFQLSYGMYIITAMDNTRPVGCIVNVCSQITAEPVTLTVCVSRDNYTNKCIKETGKAAICILTEDADSKMIGTFGYKSSKDIEKFENIKYTMENDLPVLNGDGICGYVTGTVIDTVEVETHTLFILKVDSAVKLNDNTPMTYSYYREVKRGKSPKNAPTYAGTQAKTETKPAGITYVCTICGHEVTVEGELPDDYVCPVCGVGKEFFKKKD